MPIDRNAVASLAATLVDVADRLAQIARDGSEDDLSTELLEIERQLTMTRRRLDKAVRRLNR